MCVFLYLHSRSGWSSRLLVITVFDCVLWANGLDHVQNDRCNVQHNKMSGGKKNCEKKVQRTGDYYVHYCWSGSSNLNFKWQVQKILILCFDPQSEWKREKKDHSHRLATNHAHKTNENYVVVAREYRHSLWCLGPCDLRRRSSIMYYLMWCIAFFFSATNCKWKFFRSKYFQIQMENWIRQMPEIHTHRKNLLACLFSFVAYRHSI